MNLDKEKQLEELCEEIDIILSVKDYLSDVEINNFLETFNLISEYELREKLALITGDKSYIKNNENGNNYNDKEVKKKNEVNSEHEDINFIESKIVKLEESKDEKIIYEESLDNISTDTTYDENLVERNISQAQNMEESSDEKEEQDNKEFYCEEEIDEPMDLNYIEDIPVIRGECKYGQISVEWDWPKKVRKVMVCYRFDKFSEGPMDTSCFKAIISREKLSQKGQYTIDKAEEGDYYFSVFVLKEYEGKKYFSEGQRRLVTNRKPVDIYYELKINKSLFGKIKSAQVIFSTDENNIELPQTVMVVKNNNIPIMKAEGEVIHTIDYQTLEKGKNVCIDLPLENIEKNMYAKVFFLDDSNNRIYRIVCPTKENLYIK